MDRNQAKDMLPIIQALAEGKHIQLKDKTGNWMDIDFINVEICNPNVYRIKPGPKYRPFTNVEECWEEMLKHQPFAWVKEKHSDRYNLITEVNGLSIKVKEGCLFADGIKYYTFADGTPFAVKIEEDYNGIK